jgi:hypothetical protein
MSNSKVRSSTGSGQLTLTSSTPGTRFTVMDSALRPVATTSNWSAQDLDAGVYLVEGRVGSATLKRLVTVAPGSTVREDLSVEFSAAAPTYGARTTNETHADLASALSGELRNGVGPDAGLVLILRTLRGSDPGTLHRDDLVVLDHTFRRVSEWESDWVADPHGGAAGRAARLEPGPYELRTTRRVRGRTERIDQTIWLAQGWQTLVFVPNTPSGPDPRGLSVHMNALGHTWRFDEFEVRAAEAALAGLRDGVTSIDRQTAEILLHGKFENPMLGIIGLHALMLSGPPNDALADEVVHNLKNLVGDHPDVVALASTRPDWHGGASVSWPPMLERSYRSCLLPADLRHPGTVADGSLAEAIAPLIRIPGPWLRWTVADRSRPVPGQGLGYEGVRRSGGFADAAGALEGPDDLEDRPDGGIFDHTYALEEPTYADAALRLVKRAVDEISAFQDVSVEDTVAAVSATELARRTGLTTFLVGSCLRHLGLDG